MSNLQAKLCIQCADQHSMEIGSFLAETESTHFAISPVFSSLIELFAWCKENGWRQLPYNTLFPVGLYEKY
jgi:hypothetical protein